MKILKSSTFLFLIIFFSCSRDKTMERVHPAENQVSIANNETQQNHRIKWGKNEVNYIASMKIHAARLKRFANADPGRMLEPVETEDCNGTPAVYGFYDDPDNLVTEGSYISSIARVQELEMTSCPELLSAIETARNYLNEAGYSDIVATLDTPSDRFKLVHAANTLMDLKAQVATSGSLTEVKFANCVLQAIGYSAIANLAANWATASRYAILKAVGKLATRYIGWVGAAIAVVSFTDCMWG